MLRLGELLIPNVRLTLVMKGTWASFPRPYQMISISMIELDGNERTMRLSEYLACFLPWRVVLGLANAASASYMSFNVRK